jgi:hypothetical protein
VALTSVIHLAPNVWSGAASGNANFGIFPYSQFSPFGFNGRYVYARVTLGL